MEEINEKQLYQEAMEQTPETIGDFVMKTMCDYQHDYGNYVVIFDTLGGCAEFAMKDDTPFGFDYVNVPMEVAGNIYDNPELLGGDGNA